MKIQWKRKPEMKPHCGVCGERLMGNDSIAFPYQCSCGQWRRSTESDGTPSVTDYELRQ